MPKPLALLDRVMELIESGGLILPVYDPIAMKLQEVLGREPTDEELAEELGMTATRVRQMRLASIRPASRSSSSSPTQ